jgi:hypothetical protein|tara:strand:- start:32 stop:2041 length:2010 start_codon:yes stop_codon:yes gene_type:complete
MKAGDIIETKKGPALYMGGDTKDKNNYKFPVTSGLGAAAGQGLTFRFLDEIVGTTRGILPGGVTPQQGRDLERRSFEKVQRERPAAALAAEIGGAALPALLTLGASTPVSATGIGTAAARAGLSGLAYGAGSGEGVTERIGPALSTGAISAAGGAGMQVLARPIAKLGKEIKGSFQKPEKVGKKAAQKLVKDALDYDKTDINSAIQYITNRSGKQYTLADIGPNTRAYLDAVNVIPGVAKKQAQDFLKERNEGMLPRITSDLQEAFGAKASYFDAYKAMESARSESGKILYSKAMEKKIPIDASFVKLLKRPSAQGAFKKAYELAGESGIKLPRINLQNGKMYTKQGNPVKAIDTKLLHWMKLSLDDAIYTGRSPLSGVGSTQLNLQKATKNDFLDYMDKNNKTYKRARDEWSEKTAIMDKLELGRKFDAPGQNVEEIAEEIGKMSKSELEAFRNGVLNNIVEKMEKSVAIGGRGANMAFNVIKTPRSRNLLRNTFKPGKAGQVKFDKFISNLTDEIDIKDTSNLIIGNSATAGRQEAVSTIKQLIEPSDFQNLSPVGLLYSMLKADNPQLQERAAKAAASELARILTETNPQSLKMIAKELSDKKTFTGILKNYIPKGFENILKAPISPQVIAAQSNIPGGSEAAQSLTPSIEVLMERLNKQQRPTPQ